MVARTEESREFGENNIELNYKAKGKKLKPFHDQQAEIGHEEEDQVDHEQEVAEEEEEDDRKI